MKITCGIYLYNLQIRKILICHATHAKWNQWSIPKGVKTEGEDPFIAAARELEEETGIALQTIHVIKKYPLPEVYYLKQKKMLKSFLIITDSAIENFHFHCSTLINGSFPEVDKWKWIDVVKEKSLLHQTQQENIGRIKEILKIFLQTRHEEL